jgi:uncharacterized protein YdaU (DUF1376 family)
MSVTTLNSFERLPIVPWYYADFLASTQGWTAEETGVYFLLLSREWDEGPLPNNPQVLAHYARSTPRNFKRIWEHKVEKKFRVMSDGRLANDRLEKERAESLRRVANSRKGSAITNKKRWGAPAAAGEP